jgi:hypothetical protein
VCLWRVFHPLRYPPAKGVTDPTALVSDASQFPLTNPDSAAPAERNLEVFRGLSELESIKLLGQLQEQGSAIGQYRNRK